MAVSSLCLSRVIRPRGSVSQSQSDPSSGEHCCKQTLPAGKEHRPLGQSLPHRWSRYLLWYSNAVLSDCNTLPKFISDYLSICHPYIWSYHNLLAGTSLHSHVLYGWHCFSLITLYLLSQSQFSLYSERHDCLVRCKGGLPCARKILAVKWDTVTVQTPGRVENSCTQVRLLS